MNASAPRSDPAPIACSLTADEYRRRLTKSARVAQDALRRREPIDGGVRLVFADSEAARRRVRRFAAEESQCCPFLTFDIAERDGQLVVDLTGPVRAAPIIEGLFA